MNALPALLGVTITPLSDLDAVTAHSARGCKILHLVRHAQGVHNTDVGKGPEALLSQELFDAQLSDLGLQQVENLRKYVEEKGLSKIVDLVITSPMLRTLQTAVGVFGGESQANGFDAHTGNGAKCAKFGGPPIIAVEHCRERWGLEPCNRRRSISEYQTLFPAIDFQLIESEDDIFWKADIRESYEEVAARGMGFLKWLWTRQEKEIAIVSHGIFLQQTLKYLVNEKNPSMESLCSRFDNCEIRTVAINIADGSLDVAKDNTQREERSKQSSMGVRRKA